MGIYKDNQVLRDNDLNAIIDGIKGNGVASGCVVSESSTPAMTIEISSGVVRINNSSINVVGVQKVISAADASLSRKDIISVDSDGDVTVTPGTPALAYPVGDTGPDTSIPAPPDIPAGEIILAEIWIGASKTEITDDEITDRRIIISISGIGSGIAVISTPDDGEVHLTPKASSSGAEGTMFYDSDDNSVYVATE
jgi:hypothetical protein